MGDVIGPYELQGELGRGGMGVVYLAQDTRLGRSVAIKSLPEGLAADPARLERFEREARTLATLNHPNVAGIHGVEEQDGAKYLVLEYVEGETLADRLDRGPIPVDEALEFAAQIAAGVEAAHAAGVVHRDLKPGNIIITPEGQAKVLDFGLARTDEPQSSSGGLDSPTITTPQPQHSPTIEGAILGTAAYMSPEQARGRRIDRRTDIWSFGVVLYEMLVGASPFHGETATDSIGAVLHKDLELDRLPQDTPRHVRRVLQRCLQRDKNFRYHDIADARLDLLSASVDLPAAEPAATGGGRLLFASGWILALGAIAGLIVLSTKPKPAPTGLARLDMDIAPRHGLELMRLISPPRISPDSSMLAYLVVPEGEHEPRLAVRDLHTGDERVLRGPQGPSAPVWTSDGSSLIYVSARGIEQIDVNGGRPRTLSEHLAEQLDLFRSGPGGIDRTGRFAFSQMRGTLNVIDPDSAEPVQVMDPIPEREGDWAIAPQFLPDGEHVLFTNQDDVTADSGLYVGSLVTGDSRRLLPYETSCVFVEPDILVYWKEGALLAQRFDLQSLEFDGEPVQVAESVLRRVWPVFGVFDASASTLAYVTDESSGAVDEMTILDFETDEETPLDIEGSLWSPQISPDGTKLAFDRTVDTTSGDIYVLDLTTGEETVVSRDEANESIPVWSPDGEHLYFFRGPDIYRAPADASHAPSLVYSSSASSQPQAVSPDGTTLLFSEGESNDQTMLLDLQTGEAVDVAINDSGSIYGRGFTTDGAWLLYINDSSGEERVFAARLDDTGDPVPISQGFGVLTNIAGEWVYYRTRTDLMRARVRVIDGELVVGERERLVDIERLGSVAGTPDGKRLVIIRAKQPRRGGSIRVIRNWMPESLR